MPSPDSLQPKVPTEPRPYKSTFRADASKGPRLDGFLIPMPSSSFPFGLFAHGCVRGRGDTAEPPQPQHTVGPLGG